MLQTWATRRNNPIVNVDPDGRETTIFYRAPAAGGSSGSPKDFGHIFIHVRNSEAGKGAYFDYYPNGKSSVIGQVDQQRLDNHSRLTIQTTPQQEQKMLDAISAKQNDVPKYDASPGKILTGNESTCVTQTENILNAGGLNISGTTPTDVWQSAYSQFSAGGLDWKDETNAAFQQSPFYNPGPPPTGPGNAGYDNPQPGQEYGRDPSGDAGKVDPDAQKNENIERKDEPN